MIKFQVYDRQTQAIIGNYSTLGRALNKIDKLDNAYGGYRYNYRRVTV